MTLRNRHQAGRRRDEQSFERRAKALLDDHSRDRLRTPGARRALVIAMTVLIIALPVVSITVDYTAALLVVVPAGLTLLLLRSSVRTIADLPDEYLDERQIALRNLAYLKAYRLLAAGAVLLVATAMVFGHPGSGTEELVLTWDQVNGFFWFTLTATLALPSMIFALSDTEHP